MEENNYNFVKYFESEFIRLEQKIDLTNKNLELLISKIESNADYQSKITDAKVSEFETIIWEQAQRLNSLECNVKKIEKYFYIAIGIFLTVNFLLNLVKTFIK